MFNKKAGLVAVLVSLSLSDVLAGTLSSYSIGDVLICFRKTGATTNLVVDIGPVSTYTNLAANSRTVITQYTGTQLGTVGTNNLDWSAFTWFNGTVTPTAIRYTLFASNPRASLNTQTDPYIGYSQSAQQQAANTMAAVPKGAFDNFVTTLYNASSTATAVIEPDNNNSANYKTGQSYSYAIGQGGNEDFNGYFQGLPENTTPANFTAASTVQRSDFYWIPPGDGFSTQATFLGYFELNTNGVMTYVAYPSALPAIPVIKKIGRTNNISYITFTTGSTGTYTLRGTNVLRSAAVTTVTNWPVITSTTGNGSVTILQDATTASNRFYVITAQ